MRKIIVPIFVFLLVSCQRNDAPVQNNTPDDGNASLFFIEILNEYILANQVFQDAGNNAADAILMAEGSATGKINGTKTDPSIAIEPFDLETFPKTITVDFGSGIVCKDGVTRKGVITIVSTGWYREIGSTHTTTFDNYYHDVYKVEGTRVVENLGTNEDGHLEFYTTVENGVITATNGVSTIAFDEVASRTWIAGAETPLNIWDDEYLLDANQWGFSSTTIGYQLVFDEPLYVVLEPRAVKSGIINLEIGGVKDIIINYNNRTTTILGVTRTF